MNFTSKMSKAVKHNMSSGPPCNPKIEMKELTICQSATGSDYVGIQSDLLYKTLPAAETTTK